MRPGAPSRPPPPKPKLDNVGVYDNVTDYREILAGFTSRFPDLRRLGTEAFLDPDPAIRLPRRPEPGAKPTAERGAGGETTLGAARGRR